MEKGNTVRIIPNEFHVDEIKKFYGKDYIIEDVRYNRDGTPYYKLEGVPDYAIDGDIELV